MKITELKCLQKCKISMQKMHGNKVSKINIYQKKKLFKQQQGKKSSKIKNVKQKLGKPPQH